MYICIAAVSKNCVIGKDWDLVWKNKEDLARFKRLTNGNRVIMWRKTAESLPVFPLPNRDNQVLSRGKKIIETPYANNFVIGWGQIYKLYEDRYDLLYLTEIHKDLEWDTYFDIDMSKFIEVSRQKEDGYDYVVYMRK